MSRRVNILLLLSALLSALTGVSNSARAQEQARAVAEGSIAVARTATATRVATWRPLAVSITLADAARLTGGEPLVLAPGEPVFASRRRE
ncbi:MAG: hypothetical protein K0R56_896 [Sphingomonas sp.]|jgi:uncharacterized membrane-anchored protein|nr:hypothetical protein [Sphingomonas sp.]